MEWRRRTGERLDERDTLLTVCGMRPRPPPGAEGAWRAREPAWRLLHAIALRELFLARSRAHAAHHAERWCLSSLLFGPNDVMKKMRACFASGDHENSPVVAQRVSVQCQWNGSTPLPPLSRVCP